MKKQKIDHNPVVQTVLIDLQKKNISNENTCLQNPNRAKSIQMSDEGHLALPVPFHTK